MLGAQFFHMRAATAVSPAQNVLVLCQAARFALVCKSRTELGFPPLLPGPESHREVPQSDYPDVPRISRGPAQTKPCLFALPNERDSCQVAQYALTAAAASAGDTERWLCGALWDSTSCDCTPFRVADFCSASFSLG